MQYNPTNDPARRGELLQLALDEFFQWCAQSKVTVVLAAGNDRTVNLHNTVPQKLGSATNKIITVGGVEKDGTFWQPQTTQALGQAGHVTVYAPCVDIRVPSPGVDFHTGTSQAAAIVVSIALIRSMYTLILMQSGLAAYFYGLATVRADLPELSSTDPNFVGPNTNMKQFIRAHSWTRVQGGVSIDVVYNLARGDTAHPGNPCAIGSKKRDGEAVSACSRPLSSATKSV